MKKLPASLRFLRQIHQLTIEQLNHQTNYALGSKRISELERGQGAPMNVEEIEIFAHAFNLNSADILTLAKSFDGYLVNPSPKIKAVIQMRSYCDHSGTPRLY